MPEYFEVDFPSGLSNVEFLFRNTVGGLFYHDTTTGLFFTAPGIGRVDWSSAGVVATPTFGYGVTLTPPPDAAAIVWRASEVVSGEAINYLDSDPIKQPATPGLTPNQTAQLDEIHSHFVLLPPGPIEVVSAASSPDRTNAYLTTCDAAGAVLGNTTVLLRLVQHGGEGHAYTRARSLTSNAQGLLSVELLKNALYEIVFNGATERFTTSSSDTFPIPNIVAKQ